MSKVAKPLLLVSAPWAGLRPARPPEGMSKVAKPHLLMSGARAHSARGLSAGAANASGRVPQPVCGRLVR
jgi:hypothetical protein